MTKAAADSRFSSTRASRILSSTPRPPLAQALETEIPNATFVSLRGQTHFSAERVSDQLLPRVLELFRRAVP